VTGIRVETIEEYGVKQARTTVTYCFSQPDQPMALILPQSYSASRVIRIFAHPKTIGDHIRRKRLALKMLQRDVARQLRVDVTTVHNWEVNTSSPRIGFMPAVIRFPGHDPIPPASTLPERLIARRTTLGLSQKEAARRLGIDPGTLASWEHGAREPGGTLLARVKRFLVDENAPHSASRRTG
jgi:DNA-binding transcriptional regulator YiaG